MPQRSGRRPHERVRQRSQAIPTPSVRTGFVRDLYVTLVQPPKTDGAAAVIGFYVQPMIVWMWIGLGLMAIGTLLALFPGRRRRPTSPTSVASHVDGSHEALDGTASTPNRPGATDELLGARS